MNISTGNASSLTIVLMNFNESASLECVVSEIIDVFGNSGITFDILIIDDGSTDGSQALIEGLQNSHGQVPIRSHFFEENRGLGQVYRTGLLESRGQFVTFLPADGQIPPTESLSLLRTALEGGYDLVLGVIPNEQRPIAGRILSRFEQAVYRLLFGRLPRFQGPFLLKRSRLDELELTSQGRGWVIVFELVILAARGGWHIKSVPSALKPRLRGRSKVTSMKCIYANLSEALKLFFRLRVQRSSIN